MNNIAHPWFINQRVEYGKINALIVILLIFN